MTTLNSVSIFSSGIRPAIDDYLALQASKVRDYGDYWSASSAGYCQRKLIFERLGVPYVKKDDDARKQRVFSSGHLFHEFMQRITKEANLSIGQEIELLDDDLMVKGHADDLIEFEDGRKILYDYKTAHSRSFHYAKDRPMSYYHRLQLATYLHMLRWNYPELEEGRVLSISKDDLCLAEKQLLWSEELSSEVRDYWTSLNKHWAERKIPPCTCHVHENGFMAKEKFNPYFYEDEPCSLKLLSKFKKEQANV